MESYENQYNLNKLSNLDDLRGLDLSGKDFKGVSVDILEKIDFDSKTKWPDQERMPNGFNPEALMESGKNPGLGIMELHKDGIDGKGVKVAIIDQTLSSNTGELMKHREYISQITDYHDYGSAITENVSMHGPAVASLFVGKTCGVAPGSELVYRAVPCGNDLSFHADALLDIVERNRSFPPKDKVRIVSCSYGYMEDKPRPGLDRWMKAIEKAEAEGIIVSDVGDRTGVDYIGGGTYGTFTASAGF